jgi:hypothetical protein
MEIWLDSLGVGSENETQSNQSVQSAPLLGAIQPLSSANGSYVEDGDDLDVVFIVYANGLSANNVNMVKNELKQSAAEIFDEAANRGVDARLYYVIWTGMVTASGGKNYAENLSEAETMIDGIVGINTNTLLPTDFPLSTTLQSVKLNLLDEPEANGGLRTDSKKSLFVIDYMCYPDTGNTANLNVDYPPSSPAYNAAYNYIHTLRDNGMETYFVMNAYGGSKNYYVRLTSTITDGNGNLDYDNLNYDNCFEMTLKPAHYALDEYGNQLLDENNNPIVVPARLMFSDFVYSRIFFDFAEDFGIILGTSLLQTELGYLDRYSGIDSDDDGLTDWNEVFTELIFSMTNNGVEKDILNEDDLPTFGDCQRLLAHRYYISGALDRFLLNSGSEISKVQDYQRVLLINANPNDPDSNGNGLLDGKATYFDETDETGAANNDGRGKKIAPKDTNPLRFTEGGRVWKTHINTMIDPNTLIPTEYGTSDLWNIEDDTNFMRDIVFFPIARFLFNVKLDSENMEENAEELVPALLSLREGVNNYEGYLGIIFYYGVKKLFFEITAAEGGFYGNMQTDEFEDNHNLGVIYHSTVDAWVRYMGYNDFFDECFAIGSNMRRQQFFFEYDDNNEAYSNGKHVLWLWKGDYWNMGAGTEMGVYRHAATMHNTEHYDVIKFELPMTIYLYSANGDDFDNIFCWEPRIEQWWATGFVPAYRNADPSVLYTVGTVNFVEDELSVNREAMYDGLKAAMSLPQNRYISQYLLFDDDDHTVWVCWK